MGFVGEAMRNAGIEWYYILGLLIFLSLFIVIVYRTLKIPKSVLKEQKESILDNDEPKEFN